MSKTYLEQWREALAITTRAMADVWLESEVAALLAEYPERFEEPEQAAALIRSNLGYLSGYYGMAEAEHVYRLFDAEHPILGTPEHRASLTPEEIYAMGQRFGAGLKGPLP